MNQYRRNFRKAVQLCSLALLTVVVAATAHAQTPVAAPADDYQNNTRNTLTLAPRSRSLSAPLSIPATNKRALVREVSKEFEKAWHFSGDGTIGCEAVVLIFRMPDGSFAGKLQGFTPEYKKTSFEWNPAAQAIVHTHPNGTEPRPSDQDKRVAHKYGVPIFTITIRGMYVYEPATKKTSKVLNDLEWLDPVNLSKWTQAISSQPKYYLSTGFRVETCMSGTRQDWSNSMK